MPTSTNKIEGKIVTSYILNVTVKCPKATSNSASNKKIIALMYPIHILACSRPLYKFFAITLPLDHIFCFNP